MRWLEDYGPPLGVLALFIAFGFGLWMNGRRRVAECRARACDHGVATYFPKEGLCLCAEVPR